MNYRNWDLWNRYFDDSNNPLRGCVEFYVADGDSRARIFDSDGTPMSNPVLTDVFGRTERQVFVDTDVVARFYKYIGTGSWSTQTDIDTSDVTKWSPQYSVDSKLDVTAELSTDTVTAVSTVEDLRAINPDDVPEIDGVKFVQLLGYFTAGDKSPVFYWYDESSTETDDAGSIIQGTELTGRWKLVAPDVHLDVRHFGVFPSASLTEMSNQRVQISRAISYANRVGLRVWFPKYENSTPNLIEYKWYRYDNLDVTFINGLDVDNGVTFVDEGTASTFRTPVINGDPLFWEKNTTLYSNYAKATWNIRGLYKYNQYNSGTYVIDSAFYSTGVTSLTDFDVVVDRNITGYSFTNCRLTGNGTISNSTISHCIIDMHEKLSENNSYQDCVLREHMFNGSMVATTSVSGCTIDIDDFTNKLELWSYLSWLAGESVFDYRNHSIPENMNMSFSALDKNYVFSNFIGNGRNRVLESSVAHTYTFNNCTGTIELQFNASGNQYTFNNCNVVIYVSANKTYENVFVLNNSTVIFKDNLNGSTISAKSSEVYLRIYYKNVSLRDSTLNQETIGTMEVETFTSFNSILLKAVKSKNTVIKDSQINRKITVTERELDDAITVTSTWDPELSVTTSYIIDGTFDNNIFNAQLAVQSAHSDTLVRGLIITNNNSFLAEPIQLNKGQNIRKEDDLHYYVYKNNSGTMEMSNVVPVVHIEEMGNPPWSKATVADHAGILGHAFQGPIERNSEQTGLFATTILEVVDGTAYWDYSRYFAAINLFSIGYENVKFNVEVGIYNTPRALLENENSTYDKYPMLTSGNEILTAPRSQGYSYSSYGDTSLSYPYHVQWHPSLQKWIVKTINIGIGDCSETPSSESPLNIVIKQV